MLAEFFRQQSLLERGPRVEALGGHGLQSVAQRAAQHDLRDFGWAEAVEINAFEQIIQTGIPIELGEQMKHLPRRAWGRKGHMPNPVGDVSRVAAFRFRHLC